MRLPLLTALPVAVGLGATPLAAQVAPPFPTGLEIDVGDGPTDLDLGDLNGDGSPDLIATAGGSDELWVVLADTAGSLLPGVAYAQQDPFSLALGDLDADGFLDVAVAAAVTFSSGSVVVWTGGPGGVLTQGVTLAVTGQSREVEVADFDQDGDVDIAVRSDAPTGVQLAQGLGGGSFAVFLGVANFTDPLAIEVGDLNGDGLPDLAVADGPGEVRVLRGAVGVGLEPGATIPTCGTPLALEPADFTGDGLVDLAVGCAPGASAGPPTASGIELYAAAGGGAFVLQSTTPLAAHPTDLRAGDLDGDGTPDLAVATGFDYSILLGSGTGFAPLGSWPGGVCDEFGCDFPRVVELVDLDQDGLLDLAGIDGVLRVLRGTGAGALEGARLWRYGITGLPDDVAPFDLVAIDLDGDGLPELAAPDGAAGLALLEADGAGGLLAAGGAPGGVGLTGLHTVQLDGDGVPDLISVGTDPNRIYLQRGDGQGSLMPPVEQGLPDVPVHSATGDLDGDGQVDAAVALGSELRLVRTNAAGGFAGQQSLPFDNPEPEVVGLGDFDVDGDLDVVGVGYRVVFYPFGSDTFWDPTYRVYQNDGAGGFALHQTSNGFDLRPMDLAVADFDADGVPDMGVLGDYTVGSLSLPMPPRLRIYFGGGQGAFVSSLQFSPNAGNGERLWAADLDGDGLTDAVAGGATHVDFLANAGAGVLAAPVRAYAGMSCEGGALVDLDGDGWLDLARGLTGMGGFGPFLGGFYGEPSVSVLRHRGQPAPGLLPFGTGSPGCNGWLGLGATLPPAVGEAGFALVGSGVAPGSTGLAYLAPGGDVPGSDPLGLGLVVHLDLLSAFVLPVPFAAGPGGAAHAPLPIPPAPGLVNQVVYAQGLWLQPPVESCGPALLNLASSRGLRIVIQP